MMELTAEHIHEWLDRSDDLVLNTLPYGVVGLDVDGHVCRYNTHESEQARLSPADVIGRAFFARIAPCMDNALVAKRFQIAAEKSVPLDALIDYVLAFKSGAGPVKMRLLYSPGSATRYLLIKRINGNSL